MATAARAGPRTRARPAPRGALARGRAAAAAAAAPVLPFRVGHGFDLHRLEPGYKLWVGGVDIPHVVGCAAHSDGDVLLHCITDSILGGLSLPDIGQIFPDNDPKWKGQASDVFLKEACRLAAERGYVIGNIDATLIAQKPKMAPHKEQIMANIAEYCGIDRAAVNVKAKTHEKVDSLGENRSIACHSVVMLVHKNFMPDGFDLGGGEAFAAPAVDEFGALVEKTKVEADTRRGTDHVSVAGAD